MNTDLLFTKMELFSMIEVFGFMLTDKTMKETTMTKIGSITELIKEIITKIDIRTGIRTINRINFSLT